MINLSMGVLLKSTRSQRSKIVWHDQSVSS